MQFKFGPNRGRIAAIEAVFRKLLLLHQANVPISFVLGPPKVVNALDALKERADAFETVGELHGDRVKINSAALLKVGELCDFQTIQKHLPSNTPRSQGGRLPVVFFKSNVVFLQVDADSAQTLQVDVLHIHRRGLKDHLKLGVFVQPIGILAVAAVGGPTTGLNVGNPIGMCPKHAQKRLRVHRAGANFYIIRLLQHATLLHPKVRELKNQILEGEALWFFLKFYFRFQAVSKSSRVAKRRSR